MSASRAELLTAAQKECLRLVMSRHNSKEIVVRVGVSPSAIDKRIERAVQILGVTNRFAAARALAEFESGRPESAYDSAEGKGGEDEPDPPATSERTTSEPFDVAESGHPEAPVDADGPRWSVARLFGLSPDAGEDGTVRNPLGRLQRLGVIAMLIVTVAFTTMALLNMGQTLSTLLAGHG